MSTVALYANTFLWILLVTAYEQHGSVVAHKIRVCLGQDWDCPCTICHPSREFFAAKREAQGKR